jgi:hypothetical protein
LIVLTGKLDGIVGGAEQGRAKRRLCLSRSLIGAASDAHARRGREVKAAGKSLLKRRWR